MKKILFGIFILIIVAILILVFVRNKNSSEAIGTINRCEMDGEYVYAISFNLNDGNEVYIRGDEKFSCNWAWGPPSEPRCNELPIFTTDECTLIFASPENIYGEPVTITKDAIYLMKEYRWKGF